AGRGRRAHRRASRRCPRAPRRRPCKRTPAAPGLVIGVVQGEPVWTAKPRAVPCAPAAAVRRLLRDRDKKEIEQEKDQPDRVAGIGRTTCGTPVSAKRFTRSRSSPSPNKVI